jgi:hypothetical protein
MHEYRQEVDVSDIHRRLIQDLDNKSTEEQLVYLGMSVGFQKKQDLKDSIENKCSQYPLSVLFGTKIIDSDGKTVVEIPPLRIDGKEQDLAVLELHMWHEGIKFQSLMGQHIWHILKIIIEQKEIHKCNLDFLLEDNFFIPKGREDKFKRGLLLGLQEDYASALDILIPQFENALRELAEMCDVFISTFEDDRTEQAKMLSSILTAPEFVERYDEDIVFCLRGLLCEKAGSNLRNLQAHGLLEDGNRPIYAYCWGVIMHFIVMYSPKAQNIMLTLYSNIAKNSDDIFSGNM